MELPATNDGFALVVEEELFAKFADEDVDADCEVVDDDVTLCGNVVAARFEVCVVPTAVEGVVDRVGITIGFPFTITL